MYRRSQVIIAHKNYIRLAVILNKKNFLWRVLLLALFIQYNFIQRSFWSCLNKSLFFFPPSRSVAKRQTQISLELRSYYIRSSPPRITNLLISVQNSTMCNSKIAIITKKSSRNTIAAQLHDVHKSQVISISNRHMPYQDAVPSIRDSFRDYSENGVAAKEFEAFGIRHRPTKIAGFINERKTRVATEIHPDLIMFELLCEEEGLWTVNIVKRSYNTVERTILSENIIYNKFIYN